MFDPQRFDLVSTEEIARGKDGDFPLRRESRRSDLSGNGLGPHSHDRSVLLNGGYDYRRSLLVGLLGQQIC
jgi:hypothetical protein